MQNWLAEYKKVHESIEIAAGKTEIHKSRSKTLANRVKFIFDGISLNKNTIDMSNVLSTGYLAMLSATLEEIYDYLL